MSADASRRMSVGTRNVQTQRMIDASRTAPFRHWPRRRVLDSFGGFDYLECGHKFNSAYRGSASARHCWRCFDGEPRQHDLATHSLGDDE